MANVTGIDLNPILQRLNSTSNYHPFDAETFSDWATEAGDIVSISRNGETYVSPVHTSRMVWKGKAPTMQISTTGNEKRDAVSRVSRKKYGRGSAGVRSQEGIHRNFVSEDGILHSELHITESYLRTEFHDETNSLRSYFDMTASHMRTEFLDQVHSLRSEFEVTASHLRTEFEDDVNSLRGEFEVTASHLRTDFEDNINSLRGEFEVTASHLRTEFTDEVHSLRGEFEVTASHLRTEFEDDVNSVRSYMHETASSWEARVEGVTDANGNITAASIALAVNSAGSEARINADRIYLLGQTIADVIDADYISAKIANMPTLNGIVGQFSGNLICAGLIAQQVYVGSGPPYTNISDGIAEVQISGPTGNTYKLQYKKFSDSTWQDAGTFSRATTLSGAWSGRNFTVTASPQGNELYTDLWSAVPVSNITWNGTVATLNLYATLNGGETTYSAGTVTADVGSFLEAKTGTAKITQNGTFTPGTGFVGFSQVEVDVTGGGGGTTTIGTSWNNGILTITASPQGVTETRVLQQNAATWSGNTVTIPIESKWGSSQQYSEGVVYSATADVSAKITSAGYAGRAAVTLDDPTWNPITGATPDYRTVTVTTTGRTNTSGTTDNLSKSVALYLTQGSWSSNQLTVSMRAGGTSGTVYASTTVDASTLVTSAGYAGRANVTLNDPTWNPVTGATPDYRTVTVTTTGRTNASGTTDNLSKSVALYLTQGSWSSNQLTVSMRAGGTSGTVYASTTVDASSIYTNGQKNGWLSYWNRLQYPKAKTNAGTANAACMTVYYPSSTYDTAYDSIAKVYTISSGDNTAYMKDASGNVMAEITHNKYTAGYNSARMSINTSTKKVTKTSSGSVNEYTLALIQDSISTTAGDNYGKRKVWIKATPDSGNAVEVSAATLSDYRSGWTAAANMVSVPTAAGTNAYVTVTYPPATVGGSKGEVKYYVTADNSMAYIRAGSTSGTIVARASHSAYNNGYNANHSGWIAYDKAGATSNQGYLGVGRYIHAYTNNINGVATNSGGYWWVSSAWFRYVSGAGSNHQGDLASDSYIELIYTNSDASGDVRGTGATWHVPKASSTSHSVSVSSQNIWHGQSRADVLDRMGISSFSYEWGIGSGSPYWGFKASCGGSTRNFLVYRA